MLKYIAKSLAALAILVGFQLIGELLQRALALPIPGPAIGMALLAGVLIVRRRPPAPDAALGRTSNALLIWMGLLFVPAGVGLMEHVDLIEAQLLPITVGLVGSSLAGVIVTGLIMQHLVARRSRRPVSEGALHAD
ncbi:MAG: CidA/LrgA family protein [Acetobacteraceae bacterium]|nr:CidA/LrgA family protein [Acetobacteraceae bacterium]